MIFIGPQPLARIEQNAPGLAYHVRWKRADIGGDEWQAATVHRPDAWNFVVPYRQETYKPFDITVGVLNMRGAAKAAPKAVIGYSGEDGE